MNQRKTDPRTWTLNVPVNASATGKKQGGRKTRSTSRVQIYRDLAMALIGSSLPERRPIAS